ncbi:transposase [Bacillus sp. DJP31]|uniref:transposase n=1 Tax=Bacillus sp. DJP31 TaxID=3409789 RepID=UPI003BB6C2CC
MVLSLISILLISRPQETKKNLTYNGHYQTMGYHPLFLFDRLTGDCIKVVLRSGSARSMTFKLCSSCLYKGAFWQTLSNIQQLQVRIK